MSEFTDADYYDVCLNGSHHVIRCIERVEILFKYPVDNFNSHKSGGWNVYMFCLDNLKWKVIDPKDTAYNSGMQKYQVNYIEVDTTPPHSCPKDLVPEVVQRQRQKLTLDHERRAREENRKREKEEREKQGISTKDDWFWDF